MESLCLSSLRTLQPIRLSNKWMRTIESGEQWIQKQNWEFLRQLPKSIDEKTRLDTGNNGRFFFLFFFCFVEVSVTQGRIGSATVDRRVRRMETVMFLLLVLFLLFVIPAPRK